MEGEKARVSVLSAAPRSARLDGREDVREKADILAFFHDLIFSEFRNPPQDAEFQPWNISSARSNIFGIS